MRSEIGRETMRRRGEMVERSFAHILDRRGIVGLAARPGKPPQTLLIDVGVQSRRPDARPVRSGTPREAAETRDALMFVLRTEAVLVFGLIAVLDAKPAAIVTVASPPRKLKNRHFFNGLLSSSNARCTAAETSTCSKLASWASRRRRLHRKCVRAQFDPLGGGSASKILDADLGSVL